MVSFVASGRTAWGGASPPPQAVKAKRLASPATIKYLKYFLMSQYLALKLFLPYAYYNTNVG
jgi:hypothetical protein